MDDYSMGGIKEDWTPESRDKIVYCLTCGAIGHTLPQDETDPRLHKGCGGIISPDEKITNEQYDAISIEDLKELCSRVAQIVSEFANSKDRLNDTVPPAPPAQTSETPDYSMGGIREKWSIESRDKVVFCLACGAIGHTLPQDPSDIRFHANCGGPIAPYPLITNEQYDLLSAEELKTLREKIARYGCLSIDELKAVREEMTENVCPYTEPRRSTPTIPRCPTCQSPNIKRITPGSRMVSVFGWGLASDKIGKQFECLKCGYKW